MTETALLTTEEGRALRTIKDRLGVITPEELGELLGKEETTLKRWRSSGEGPGFFSSSGKIYYFIETVQEWMRENEKTTGRQRRARK